MTFLSPRPLSRALSKTLFLGATLFALAIAPAWAGEGGSPSQPRDVDDVDPTGASGQSAEESRAPARSDKNPVLPPKWAFGVLYACYWGEDKVLDAAERLRKEYCGDLIWIDSSWLWHEYNRADRYTCFQFDTNQFKDARAMIAKLRANHFNFGLWQWPYIDISITNLYQEGERNRYFITDKKGGEGKIVNGGGWHGVTFTGQVDFTNPKAVEWWKSLHQPLLDMGVNFFKIDTYATLPRGGTRVNRRTGETNTSLPGIAFDGSDDNNMRRLYHKTYYELTEKASGGRGFYLAHRTPTPENDQYPGMWTGDTRATWAGFIDDMVRGTKMNTPNTAAYWTCDTGGYNNDYEGDELYIRWLQYGCFLPITEFFSAKQTKGRFPWLFGADAQRNFKFYTMLRYRLLPFRYSNAQICYHEKPVKYPVRFSEGSSNQIILGNGNSEMLVAPVYVDGARSREVDLPKGANWIDYWTGESRAGGTTITADAPLDRVPIFIKAGSIIPMGPEMGWVDEKPADPLTLDVYPSGKSSYTLYEDDGKSNDYKQGEFARTVMTSETTPGKAVIEIAASQGDYDGKLANRTYILKVNRPGASLRSVTRNNTPLRQLSPSGIESAAEGWFADPKAVWVKFSTPTSTANRVVLDSPAFE